MPKASNNDKHNEEIMDTQDNNDVRQSSSTPNKSSNEDVVKINQSPTNSKQKVVPEVNLVGQKKMEIKKKHHWKAYTKNTYNF